MSINEIPDTESLKDTYERVINFYKADIKNKAEIRILPIKSKTFAISKN